MKKIILGLLIALCVRGVSPDGGTPDTYGIAIIFIIYII